MGKDGALEAFQSLLDEVVRTGERREVEAGEVPDVQAWDHLDSKGCVIWVEKGHWWILPPRKAVQRPAA
jgi:hypothetical protein